MPRPNLYADSSRNPFGNVPEALQTSDIRVLFATDRFPQQESTNEPLNFGSKRSSHLQVGFCRVNVGKRPG